MPLSTAFQDDLLEKEKEIYLDQAKASGKPQEIAEKMGVSRLAIQG